MALDDLIRSMETAAEEKIHATEETARQEAELIISQAHERAAAIKGHLLRDARKHASLERNKQIFQVKTTIQQEEVSARQKLFSKAMMRAEEKMSNIRENQMYNEIFERLMDDIIDALSGEEIILHIDQRDKSICDSIIANKGMVCEIKADIKTIGGLNASSADGKIRSSNTIESRLLKAADELSREIYFCLEGTE